MYKDRIKQKFFALLGVLFFGGLFSAGNLLAAIPPCMDSGKTLAIDNAQVLEWKQTTANQFLARAHVQGPIVKIYPDRNGHKHFEIKIGPAASDTLEVVYSLAFGKLPTLKAGMKVEACGDYITSTAQSGSYPPSPDGAIIHWVHRNPSGKHDSGYTVVDGVVYGGYGPNGTVLPEEVLNFTFEGTELFQE